MKEVVTINRSEFEKQVFKALKEMNDSSVSLDANGIAIMLKELEDNIFKDEKEEAFCLKTFRLINGEKITVKIKNLESMNWNDLPDEVKKQIEEIFLEGEK